MTARPLNAVLRALADTGPPETDADLLRRFAATRDDEAFATLVKRHGRLVWAVCRHLTRSDAEADDAFQATFLVLVRNAAVVKDAAKLSAWLHGVAYKVCGKSRLSARRRSTREQVAAARERNGHAVPDSAWDRALAAVHEEVSGLPDTLRVPFVLCCLEGKGQTEAAEQLGWKLGTLSGRLTRAKDAVLARLSARGLTLGVLAAVGLAVVPSDVSAKAVGLGLIGSVIPGSVLQLSTGVIGMSVNKVKLLAAGVLAALGVAVSGGAGWVASADAQTFTAQQPKSSPADRVKQLEAELQRAKAEAAAEADATAQRAKAKVEQDDAVAKYKKALADYERLAKDNEAKGKEKAPKVADDATNATKNNDYQFVVVKPMAQREFMQFLQEHEDKGWIFSGTAPMDDPKQTVWVFRRPKGGVNVYTVPSGGQYQFAYPTPAPTPKYEPKADPSIAPPAVPPPPRPAQGGPLFTPPAPPAPAIAPGEALKPFPPTPPSPADPVKPAANTVPGKPAKDSAADEAAALEDAIKKLQERLTELKKSKSKEKKPEKP